ncbi:MAG: MBL fold metallo-hydrolase [Gracilibacteraceae bacterium]|jgi:glyoxylase-like metal-dependent hydrolase (beta-lactamase superfamily II)|nr:MBL fold metallo-hydrolase [Gracilibacteraceae bacterium]
MGYKLIHIKGNTWYLDGAAKIGIIKNTKDPRRSIVIDTGLDDDAGRRLMKVMQEEGMGIGAIINTHSHADHCGGNHIIKSRTDCVIYAPSFDKGIIEYPELEPFYLYSAYPLKELDTKFLKAKGTRVDYQLEKGKQNIAGVELEIVPLHGHTPGMIGVATADNVLFAGDSFFSVYILEKHGIPYFTGIREAIGTLESMKHMHYEYYVPSHGDVLTDPQDTLNANIKILQDTMEYIADICCKASDREEITAKLIEKFAVKQNIPQYYLTVSTASAFLSHMTGEGILTTLFEDNKLKFKRK